MSRFYDNQKILALEWPDGHTLEGPDVEAHIEFENGEAYAVWKALDGKACMCAASHFIGIKTDGPYD